VVGGRHADSADRVGRVKRRVGVVGAAVCLLPAILLAAPSVAGSGQPAGQPTQVQRVDEDPLEVTLQSMTPSVIPRRGPIQMSGLVVNRSAETWTDLKVYPWRSTTPITTVPDLDLAAETDPALSVGTRIIDTFDEIDQLDPGEMSPYTVTVPRGLLGIPVDATGVYWIGVQVLASNADGRDEFADGRVRTFIPLVRGKPDPVQAAMVVPIRADVVYARNGSLRDVRSWLRALQPGGRLHNLIQFVEQAPTDGLTLLVDPAVVEAIQRLAAGNPVRNLGPPDVGEPEPSASAAPDGEAAGVPLGTVATSDGTIVDATAHWASDWLEAFGRATDGRTLLALPYADIDVDAAAQLDPSIIGRALAMTDSSLKDLGLVGEVVVAPPSGYVSPSAIASLPNDVRILVSSSVLPTRSPDPSVDPTELSVSGHTLRLVDTSASSGGPAPGITRSALQVRQRLLAETALRALDGAQEPLVVSMPIDWNPGVGVSDFFPGLDQDWLIPITEPLVGTQLPTDTDADALVYPDRLGDRALTRPAFDAAGQLIRSGTTLQNVLTQTTEVGREIAGQALTTLSYASRDDPVQAEADALAAQRAVSRNFEGIHISAPPYVTLSSTNGRFRVDLSNDLEQAVTVKIEALTDAALTIEAPGKVELKGQSSRTLLLNARSKKLGVHQVTLLVTDSEGTALGPSDSLPIRANEVGRVIWVIIAAGGTLLFGAILLRIYRRFARRHAPAPDSGDAA
jgi:hypothetical protein